MTISQRLTRYFWLSWFWGALFAIPCLFLATIIIDSSRTNYHTPMATLMLGIFALYPLLVVGALVRNVVRMPFMPFLFRRAEAATTVPARLAWLGGGTLLLFVASVFFCLLVFLAFSYGFDIHSLTQSTERDLLWVLLWLFFFFSLPWLLTAPVAAGWVCRDWLHPTTESSI